MGGSSKHRRGASFVHITQEAMQKLHHSESCAGPPAGGVVGSRVQAAACQCARILRDGDVSMDLVDMVTTCLANARSELQ